MNISFKKNEIWKIWFLKLPNLKRFFLLSQNNYHYVLLCFALMNTRRWRRRRIPILPPHYRQSFFPIRSFISIYLSYSNIKHIYPISQPLNRDEGVEEDFL